MDDRDYQRYVHVNLPHARTIVQRVGRSLLALSPASEGDGDEAGEVDVALLALEASLREWDEDPPAEVALPAADAAAAHARRLVETLLRTSLRGDRLGLHVRNLFECLGLPEEGAAQALLCGERPDSPLR
jgi:hypothetical protein